MAEPDVARAVADAHRREWALVVASTARVVRDLDLAEECVQEAYAEALERWGRDGVPRNPAAWLSTAARRRAIDVVRRDRAFRSRLPLLVEPDAADDGPPPDAADPPEAEVPDERLRLILLCCHPALGPDARSALTLRLVCGVATPDIARAFLVPEATMAARLTRAKKKIAGSRIPYRLPAPAELPDRLRYVLDVVHLLFTVGHTAPSGPRLVRADLVEESLHLARLLRDLRPEDPEVAGLLALLLATDARRPTRTDAEGRLLTLEQQDRSRWDAAAIAEARRLTLAALPHPAADRYALQAAIAVLYAAAPTFDATDWPQILALYDRLLVVWPSPVVALNRAVPLARLAGPAAALAEIEAIEADQQLAAYPYLPAVRADLLARAGRRAEAVAAYRDAERRAGNDAERAFLAARIATLTG
jgi:RNA polymerase sigma factor (sigma-70 family)